MIKKTFSLLILTILFFGTKVLASDTSTVEANFNKYVQAANSYSSDLFKYYDSNAKIIRQVVKPNGTTVNATTNMATYKKQMVIGQMTAKIRRYKNTYTNVTTTKLANGNIKLNALRQPMKDNDRLRMYQIWHKNTNGTWVIVEELMQTKQQIFLKFADKK